MGIFRKRKVKEKVSILSAPQNDSSSHPFNIVNSYSPLTKVELDLYSSLREALPIIDAAIVLVLSAKMLVARMNHNIGT